MLSFLLRRLARLLVTVWLAATFAFLLSCLIPSDAITARLAASGATANQIEARRQALGLADPPLVQYLRLVANLARGDLGISLITGRPVLDMLREPLGATLLLAGAALLVTLTVGISLGMAAALSERRAGRWGASLAAILALATPVYWSGTLAIYWIAVRLRWLPSTGNGSDLRFLILPSLVLGVAGAGGIAQITAAALREMRLATFVMTARGKGLGEGIIRRRHMFRMAIGLIASAAALQWGFLIGGAVVTEMIFVRPGIGQVLLGAVNDQDMPVVGGVVVLSAIVYGIAGMAAEGIALLADPRLRGSVVE